MKKYKYLLFDADHTLLKYTLDEKDALRRLFSKIGLPTDEEVLLLANRFSEETWTETGLYDVHSEEIQREYHNLYRTHLKGVFEKLFRLYPCDRSPEEVGEMFLLDLRKGGNYFPHTEEMLQGLSDKTGGKYKICIITNGLAQIQYGRLEGLRKYFHKIYISEEIGFIKPRLEFFEYILKDLPAKKEECLVIGDSLSSDIAGANAAGIDTCWFNTRDEENTKGAKIEFQIHSLKELLEKLQ